MVFQWPLLLLSLGIIPILVLLYIAAQRRRRAYAVRFTNLALLSSIVGKGPGIRRHIPPLLFILALTAFLVSIGRPTAVIAVPREQAAVILVVDVSGSMSARDMQPDRITAAKQAAKSFVDSLPDNFQVGLISFNSSASVRTPLTYDHSKVNSALDTLSAEGGTAIGDGIKMALEQLNARPLNDKGQHPPATIVLLSDGASTSGVSPDIEASQAKSANIKVHTVGIGQRNASPMVRGFMRVDLDEATLQSIASETGGRYFYSAETRSLQEVYTELSSQIGWTQEKTEITALVSALGTLIMLIAGFLSLRWFQRFP